MVAQIPLIPNPLPDSLEQTPEEFELSAVETIKALNPYAAGANQLAQDVNTMALNAEAAVDGLANSVWVSGTTYTAGQVRYSPIDFLNYRRKTNGAGTTDPSADSTNWALITKTSAGGSDTTSSATDITLTATSGRLQIISMTVADKKVTLPSASTINKGVPLFVVKNSGAYRFSVHKNGGAFICYVLPGQIISFGCSDTSTAAGVWHASGQQDISNIYVGNAPEVLNSADSREICVAMLSATKAICVFKNNSNSFIHAVVLNFGSASGTPAAINAEVSIGISLAAQTASQATVAYKGPTGNVRGLVLNISGNTVTPGAIATIEPATALGSGTGLAALSTTKLLCVYPGATAGTLRERVLDIAASVITPATEAVADTSNTHPDTRRLVAAINSNKAIVGYKQNGAANIIIRLQSISVSTPSPTGTALTLPFISSGVGAAIDMAVLSSDRALIMHTPDIAYTDLMMYLIDISGTTPVLLRSKKIDLGLKASGYTSIAKLDANNIYIALNGAGSGGIDGVYIKITADDKIIIVHQAERMEAGITVADGYVACAALDSTHVMQVCRNSSTFLSARTVEIAS